MAKIVRTSDSVSTILVCEYCTNLTFKHIQDFIRHLRDQHCSREGGSFVCLYGYNGVCTSLPVEGVSDKDYVAHATKHATMQQQRKSNGQILEPGSTWTVYSAIQNLSAVLNDPFKGKQNNFFTRTWGDSFVEKVDIPKSPYLPEVTMHHFEIYLKKFARRCRKHSRMNCSAIIRPTIPNELSQNFPNLRRIKSQDQSQFGLSNIPKIFLTPNLDLSQKENFEAVFPFTKEGLLDKEYNVVSHVEQMQEKLSHYLDTVEVRIAEQVASKSQAFFNAMTSHDALMEQLSQTITVLKALRENIHQVDKYLVKNSLKVLQLERARTNRFLVYEKLKLMATVHQSQPMIQLLLSTPDYVAALDLISTTQEILLQELNGVHSFRHLSSQLTEMEKLVNKMLTTEFQKYATADLNRPLDEEDIVLDADKLVSIISGLLRQKHLRFVETYVFEAATTIRAIIKQRVIEALAASDCCSDQQAAALEVSGLSHAERLTFLHNTIHSLTKLLVRVKAVHDVMRDTVDLSAGCMVDGTYDESIPDRLLTKSEHIRVTTALTNMLISLCYSCQESLGNMISAESFFFKKHFPNEKEKSQNEDDNTSESLLNYTLNEKTFWLSDKATTTQVCQLANIVEEFTEVCEKLCGEQCSKLRSAFKAQALKFVQKFHTERKTRLTLLLESERWKQADVPPEFQSLVTYIYQENKFPPGPFKRDDDVKNDSTESFIIVGEERFAVVATVLMLMQMIHEYCRTSSELVTLSGTIGRQLAELLRHYNSRCCQLVLGAGAMQVAGLKTITSTILVLAARSLKLILWFMPNIKKHFQDLAERHPNRGVVGIPSASGGVALLDSVERDIKAHIREIEGKILTIVDNLLGGQISKWNARPPVPSKSFRNISSYLIKLHEAVSGILPPAEVESLYRTVNTSFKEKLREQLVKMNIVNNGGPQHGVVTLELTFYLEALRKLKVLPNEELNDNWMNDIWTR
ncbi:vacuolar protein sorting-associated protein 54 [Polistes fuscatus]|uniref:vacuolar protein sorting-associated protein 54 n=1 Tax=Polistes fuscatus TaxID=30207 RepID=UPI001CAA3858|nr:vacuolar protein sorting-associated protein 54 [Polistes fuscatus]